MSQFELTNPFSGEDNPTQSQLQSYIKCGKELEDYVVNSGQATVIAQTQKLRQYVQNLQTILQDCKNNQQFVNKRLQKLKPEAFVIRNKTHLFDTQYHSLNEQLQEYLTKIFDQETKCSQNRQKRIQLANQINYKRFLNLKIEDRKDIAHQVFKWILTSIYKQRERKYFFKNFQEQGIEIDGGEDLKERLGKTIARSANQDQLQNTKKFIDMFPDIQKSKYLSKVQPQITNIYEIAKLFLASIQNGRNIKQFEKLIQEGHQNNQKRFKQHHHNIDYLKDLQERITIGEHYLQQIRSISSMVTSKVTKYLYQIKVLEGYNRNDNE